MTSRKYFGTDGIRGRANGSILTPQLALKTGLAAGSHLKYGQHQHRVIIGKDTRLSGYMIESALTSGFTATGMDVLLVGPLPTPAIAMLTRAMRCDIGIVISASHNKFEDNGIKFFNSQGQKLDDATELALEALISTENIDHISVDSGEIGKAKRIDDAAGRYIEYVKNTFPKNYSLAGLKIVIDCANGAAYSIGPTILWELGAEVISIGCKPNGRNINHDCGSTHTEALRKTVIDNNADIGIALDGDADRVAIIDGYGNEISSEHIIGVIAASWQDKERLSRSGVVTTIMSNFALDNFLKERSIRIFRTPVGDRYVAAKMREIGSNLGGEASGHFIIGEHSTTGDGLLTALQILAWMVENNKQAADITSLFTLSPQVNISLDEFPDDILINEYFKREISLIEDRLSKNGRLVIRKSGTEKLLRIMVEAEDIAMAQEVLQIVIKQVKSLAKK